MRGRARAVAARLFSEALVRTGSFAVLLALFGFANATGYRRTYPTLAERIAFAQAFGLNKAVQLFYGVPHDLLTVGGYTAWRFGGFGSIIAAVWAVFASVRAYRGEEDAGRHELVLAGTITRRGAFAAAAAAVAASWLVLWLAIFIALAAARLPAGGSAFLALATVSPALAFAGAGALASQLASTRRLALELALGAVLVAFLLRVVADLGDAGWLRWLTPLGWTEELRAFAGPRPGVLALPLAAGALLLLAAGALAVRRDVGSGILRPGDTAAPRLRGLGSPLGHAVRSETGPFLGWAGGIALFAVVVGLLSTSFTPKTISQGLREQLEKLGGASIVTPAGALGFYFLFFVLAISLFACSQVAAARREEAEQQLETLLALPVGRSPWLGGRLLLAAAAAAALALTAGLLAWAGAAAKGAGVTLPAMLEAGLNCLPAALLFLGLGTLSYAAFPRAGAAVAYALVLVAFLWELLGALLGSPGWLLDLTPFEHVGLVPARPFAAGAAAVMLALGAAAAALALALFRRRDLTGA